MPLCKACAHRQRADIDRELVEGSSLRDVAGQYNLSKSSLERHKAAHLPSTLTMAHEAAEASRADELLAEVEGLRAKAYNLLLAAEAKADLKTALLGVRETRGCLELLGKLLGKLQQEGAVSVNIITAPAWLELRGIILTALAPYPEARAAVVRALEDYDGDG